MKRNWFPYLIVFTLLGLLIVLATLQYKWLGQISSAERVRLESRLKDDTKRFTEDFNREIQKIYYTFQIDAETFDSNNQNAFIKSFAYWKTQTENPELIKDIYFYNSQNDSEIQRFDKSKNRFETTEWTKEIKEITSKLNSGKQFIPILEDQTALAIPVYKKGDHVEEMIIQARDIQTQKIKTKSELKIPDKYGVLIVFLDKQTIENKIIPALVAKYFSGNDGVNYKISITDSNEGQIYQNHQTKITSVDSTAKLFNLTPNDVFFFSRDMNEKIADAKMKTQANVIFNQRNTISTENISENVDTVDKKDEVVSINLQRVDGGKPRIAVFESRGKIGEGIWTLNIQHIAGSLDQFIINTRNKNLAISFGILTLLAISMILILISSQRMKNLAQKQLDFVSSVSHEFRTPLAVIYSAGENLSDGVIGEREKVSSYGTLIKREGKKLSGMVEQILDFAGANSGKRKYDFREADIHSILTKAIEECSSIIEEKNFILEKNFTEDLPKISADANAITQAVQNLINNSLKYSNGNKWIKVSAAQVNGKIEIAVQDKGIGIKDNDLKQVFEPFYRSKSVVDEQISGNGLGLSLVKKILDDHGGNISVQSELGKGSTFVIHLPLN